jgi:CheY-like chemotaxis protein
MNEKTKPRKALLVEDDQIIAYLHELYTKRCGYEVLPTVDNGPDAIAMVREHQPDVILMDIRIRGEMDGIEAAKIIRQEFDIPIVYLTGNSDERTMARATHMERVGYLIKPIRNEELCSTLRELFLDT